MDIDDVVTRLAQHELECKLRYERIEEILEEQKAGITSLDAKIWGLALLILVTPFIDNFIF
jgi:hypothetical protein